MGMRALEWHSNLSCSSYPCVCVEKSELQEWGLVTWVLVTNQAIGYLHHGTSFGRPGLLEADGASLTKNGKSCFGRRLARLVRAALN